MPELTREQIARDYAAGLAIIARQRDLRDQKSSSSSPEGS